MLPPGFHRYEASASGLTLLADTGDIVQMIGGANPWLLLEVKVWQTGSTTLAMEDLRLIRVAGSSGAGGSALTEHEYSPSGPAATVAVTSLPTTDMGGTPNLDIGLPFNNLQYAHELLTPELWIPCAIGTDMAIGNQGAIAHTGVGLRVVWAEFIP